MLNWKWLLFLLSKILYKKCEEDESYGKQSMLLDYIIIGVGQENKSPRPHFDPNKLPSKDGGRSENLGGVSTF